MEIRGCCKMALIISVTFTFFMAVFGMQLIRTFFAPKKNIALAILNIVGGVLTGYLLLRISWIWGVVGAVSFAGGLRWHVYGLTGGIGSGKTTVSNFLRRNGWVIIDADKIARQILQPGTIVYWLVVKTFGNIVLNSKTKEIDRPKIREVIFQDSRKRKLLNAITHPLIIVEILKQILVERIFKGEKVVLDAPLLFETKLNYICSPIVVVNVNTNVQLRRLIERDTGTSNETLRAMISAQMPLHEKVSRADIVLDNNFSLDTLIEQIKLAFRIL